ncbi:hypothetical protein M9435_003416 [Picochlorum sp. BPE23]|nr:hypothetical protein M9435_003416 [Picochlorum sp. BPE23]
MQLTIQKSFVAAPQRVAGPQRGRVSVVASAQKENATITVTKTLLSGFAAATLLVSAPAAEAKVVLQQPEVKNFVKGTEPAPAAKTSSSATKAPRKNQNAGDPDAFDIKVLALPVSVAAVVGGYFALNAIDPGFSEFMAEASAKDSRGYAGYETALKDTPFYGGSGDVPKTVAGKKAATKKKKGLF